MTQNLPSRVVLRPLPSHSDAAGGALELRQSPGRLCPSRRQREAVPTFCRCPAGGSGDAHRAGQRRAGQRRSAAAGARREAGPGAGFGRGWLGRGTGGDTLHRRGLGGLGSACCQVRRPRQRRVVGAAGERGVGGRTPR